MILYLSCTIEGLDVVINFSVLLQPNVTVFREVKQLSLYQCHYVISTVVETFLKTFLVSPSQKYI